MIPKELIREFVGWARANGKKRPKTQQGMNLMVAEFLANQPAWNEIPDDRTTHLTYDGVNTRIVDARSPSVFKDDWDELMDQRERATIGPNGEHLDDFDQSFQLREQEHQALQQAAPFSRTNPVSVLNGVLGNQAVINIPGGVNPIRVVNWEGDDAETMPLSVTLVPVKQVGSATAIGFPLSRPYARIQFGTRGFSSLVEVDIGKGTQFTVSGSQIAVDVGEDTTTGTVGSFSLAATLSFRPIVRTNPITRTLYRDLFIADGDTFVVPAFAKNFRVFRNPLSEAITIEVERSDQTAIYTDTTLCAANTFMVNPIWLTSDADFIKLTYNQLNITALRVMFELSL